MVDLGAYRLRKSEVRVTKATVAEVMGVSEKTVERWQKDPTFPVHRWGRRCVRYVLSEVEAWRG